jgi:hypothetical protein
MSKNLTIACNLAIPMWGDFAKSQANWAKNPLFNNIDADALNRGYQI